MKKKILVVNNHPLTRETIYEVLRAEGNEVVLAATGQEGVRTFHADHFDLLLLDVNLPDTSGWNIFKTLNSINPFLPIAITARNAQHELEVFAGRQHLAQLINGPELMQAIACKSRQIIGAGSLAT